MKRRTWLALTSSGKQVSFIFELNRSTVVCDKRLSLRNNID